MVVAATNRLRTGRRSTRRFPVGTARRMPDYGDFKELQVSALMMRMAHPEPEGPGEVGQHDTRVGRIPPTREWNNESEDIHEDPFKRLEVSKLKGNIAYFGNYVFTDQELLKLWRISVVKTQLLWCPVCRGSLTLMRRALILLHMNKY